MSARENKIDILNYFEQHIEHFCESGNIIICGDFNIDISKKKTTHSDRLMNICNDVGLKQMVKTTTRLTNRSETIIDLCFTNVKMNVIVSIEDQISDHRNVERR